MCVCFGFSVKIDLPCCVLVCVCVCVGGGGGGGGGGGCHECLSIQFCLQYKSGLSSYVLMVAFSVKAFHLASYKKFVRLPSYKNLYKYLLAFYLPVYYLSKADNQISCLQISNIVLSSQSVCVCLLLHANHSLS